MRLRFSESVDIQDKPGLQKLSTRLEESVCLIFLYKAHDSFFWHYQEEGEVAGDFA